MTTAHALFSERSDDDAPRPGATVLRNTALVIIAVVLGFAAYQKFQTGSAFDSVISGAEIVFIMALTLLRKRWWAWVGATALFAMFAGFTSYLIWRGESSCGCFGDIETAPTFTIKIDLSLMILSMVVVFSLRRGAIFGLLASVAGFAAVAGAGASVLMATPLASSYHGDRVGLLLAAPGVESVSEHDLANPDWLVYLYDEKAADDSIMLPEMLADAEAHPDDDAMRVRVLTTEKAKELSTIPTWAWAKLPQAILFRGGQFVRKYTADEDNLIPDPATLRTQRPTGPISQILALPKYADVAYATDDLPIYIMYVYNPECPICLEHLSVLESFTDEYPDDSTVVIMPIPMDDLEKNHNLPMWSWPGVPTTYIVRGGRVVGQTAGPNGVPNPYQIRMDLQQGKPLVLPNPVAPQTH